MSHFSTIKVQFIDQSSLIDALKEVGFINIKTGQLQCRGFRGNKINVEILVELTGNYDIGFIKKENSYELIADWWGIKNINQDDLMKKLKQQYSLIVTRQELKKKGFSLKEEKLTNGTIRLVARKLG